MKRSSIVKRCELVLSDCYNFTDFEIFEGVDCFYVEFQTNFYFGCSIHESDICDIIFVKKKLGACSYYVDLRDNSIIYLFKL